MIALSACSPPAPAPVTPPVTVTASPRAVPSGFDESDESQLGDHSSKTDAEFGQAVKLAFDAGTIRVSRPEVFQPGDNASAPDGWDEYVVVEVTETNDWVDPMPQRWGITAVSDNREVPEVTDQGIGAPERILKPGESITYKLGFARSKGAPFVVTAMAPVGYDTAVFRTP